MANKVVAYNSGTVTAYGTKYGNNEVGTVSNNYRVNNGGLTWYNSPTYGNDYVMIANSYDLGYSTQGNAKPLFWVASGDANFLSLVNKLHDRKGQSAFDTVANAITWVNASNKYYLLNQPTAYVTSNLTLHLDAGNATSYPGSGSIWTSLVNGYTGTLGAGVGYSSSNGGVLTFNGASNAFVNMYGSASALSSITNNISVEAWYQSNNNFPGILRTGLSSSGFVFGYFSGTGTSWKVTKYGVVDLSTGTIPQNTAWHQVVLTYSSTTGTRIYIDGALSGTANANTTNIAAGSEFSIGKSESVQLNGSMGIFRWYSAVLSASDVLQNYNATKSRYGL